MDLWKYQLDQENMYSRKLLAEYINQYIQSMIDEEQKHGKEVSNLLLAYKYWTEQQYGYESKNRRVAHLLGSDPIEFVHELLILVLPLKYAATIQTVIAALIPRIGAFKDMPTTLDKAKTCCELIVFLSQYTDFYNIVLKDGESGVLVQSNVEFGEELDKKIQATMYLPPMVVQPKYRMNNRDSPYLIVDKHAISDSRARHDYYINLYAINLAGDVGYTIDIESFGAIKQLEPSEKELTPVQEHEREINHTNKILITEYIAQELYELSTPIYFAWFFDSRGRMYPEGYHLTPNGDSYEKANLLFADTQTPTGIPTDEY